MVAPAIQGVDAALLDDLVAANRILYRYGVLDGLGHVSVRHPDLPGHFIMARALAPGLVTADDLLAFDLDGKALDQDRRSIYSERFIHAEIYRVRQDVHAVVHSHSPTVVPFSVTETPLRAIAINATFLQRGAPVFDTRSLPGNASLMVVNGAMGKALAQVLGREAVALMRGHGNVVVGADVRRVVTRAIYTEQNARQQLQAITIGGPIAYISPEESEFMEKMSARGSEGIDRMWGMWKAEAAR